MAALAIKRVTTTPTVFEPSTLYFVRGARAGFFDIIMTGTDVTDVRMTQGIDEARVDEMIGTRMNNFAQALIYDDIAARDAATTSHLTDRMVFVRDAKDDPTVDTRLDANNQPIPSAAFYLFKFDLQEYVKLVDWNDIDLVLNWDAIQGRPVSTPTQIDDAVAKAHPHGNKVILDDLGDNGTDLTYKGVPVGTVQFANPEW